MGLELGLDLLAFGGEVFHPTILHLLGVAYELLERQEFIVILKVIFDGHFVDVHIIASINIIYCNQFFLQQGHLKDRRKLSEISAE